MDVKGVRGGFFNGYIEKIVLSYNTMVLRDQTKSLDFRRHNVVTDATSHKRDLFVGQDSYNTMEASNNPPTSVEPVVEASSRGKDGKAAEEKATETKPLLRSVDDKKTPSFHQSTTTTRSVHASRRPFLDKHNDFKENASTMDLAYPSGLDFERVVNHFSIEASRERYMTPIQENDDDDLARKTAWLEDVPMAENEEFAQARYDAIEDRYSTTGSSSSMEGPAPVSQTHTPAQQKRKHKPHPWGYTGRTATGWIFSVLTGLLTAAIAVLLASLSAYVQQQYVVRSSCVLSPEGVW